jgi:nitroreductase
MTMEPTTDPVLEAIMTTRAIRRFTDDPITNEEILTCLRAAQQGPSGGNFQPIHYLVLTDPDLKAKAAYWYRKAGERYGTVLMDPPVFRSEDDERSWHRTREASSHLNETLGSVPAMVLFLQPRIDWTPSDEQGPIDIGPLYASVYPAIQNFCVAARALGIGTVLTTVVRVYGDECLADLGVPAGRYEIAALVPMGRPSGSFGRARRKPVEKATSWNQFGNRQVP